MCPCGVLPSPRPCSSSASIPCSKPGSPSQLPVLTLTLKPTFIDSTSVMTIEQLRAKLEPVLARHGAKRAIVFGSHARGTATRGSDLDLLIIDDDGRRYL